MQAIDSSSADTIDVSEIIVKTSRFHARLKNIPGSLQLIDNETFSKMSEMHDILNTLPGVNMQSGSFQTSRLTIRGIGSRSPYGSSRIQAYYDDIPLGSGDGSTIIEDIDPLFIKNAEIIKGPNSAWYGNGLGGAIRFHSPGAEKTFKANTFTGLASYATFRTVGLVTVPYSNSQLNVGIASTNSNGYRQNSAYYRNSLFISGKVGNRFSLHYLFHLADVKSFIPSSLNAGTFKSNPEKAAANWQNVKGYKSFKRALGGFRFTNNLSSALLNAISLSFTYNNPYELRPFNILDDNSNLFNIHENLKYATDYLSVICGTELIMERYSWEILQNATLALKQNTTEKRSQINSYVTIQTNLTPQLNLSVSFNVNTSHYLVRDLFFADTVDYSGETKRKTNISPRIGINWELSPTVSLYSSFGHGLSNPTVEESLDSKGFMNIKLKPEEGWGFDIGARTSLLYKNLWIDASFYSIQLYNLLITKRISEEVFSGQNAGTASLTGVEVLMKYHANERIRASLATTFSNNRFINFIANENVSGNFLPGISAFSASGEGEFRFLKNTIATLAFRYLGKQYLTDNNDVTANAWCAVDIDFKQIIKYEHISFSVEVGTKNLLNQKYASMYLINAPSFGSAPPRFYYPAQPRNYFMSVKFNI